MSTSFAVLIVLILMGFVSAQYPFGMGMGRPCGGGCPSPICQPRLPCAPPPMPMPVCPPPPPCPAQFCPPPPICPPPPPPPMPCPPPPPPMPRPTCPCMGMMPRPMYYQSYTPQYYQPMMPQPMPIPTAGGCGGGGAVVPTVRIPAQNDCCCGCSSPCKYKSVRRAAFAAKTVDPACNSSELKNIIEENIITDDASESKRNIQKIAEETLGHDVNVICGKGEFSYIAHTDTFCQAFKDDVTCYAFKPL